MSTPPQGTYQVGGTLSIAPQPDRPCFALTTDQFLTLRDGEMSTARSILDICIGTVVTGIAGLVSLLAPLNDWRKAPMGWTLLLLVLVISALVVGVVELVRIYQTRNESAYARVVQTISEYFGI